ncbi:FtsX-like permease family protein [Anaeromyxobacter paludicola]|uniref:Permease n=1 Tax=Anaeromyxobacter paludicola TaxID=2918171 RepID=A0ABM7X690_9BACT|nr:ABC transporter permease [Anaeromyxobacter paludicola]BDG07353.1 permease [Anaeromyxobacter paludicola]
MRGYFAAALRAQLAAGRALFLLSVAGVALGVGAVLSIQILNQSALGAFAGGVRAVSGEADLQILPRGPWLPDEVVARALEARGVRAALPIWRAEVEVEGAPGGLMLELVGTDLLAPVRVPWRLPAGGIAAALSRPGWVAVTPALAAERGWREGSRLDVTLGSRRVGLEVGALVDFQKLSPLASRRLAVMDVAQAQGLFGARGRLHQVDLLAEPGADRAGLARRLAERLGPAVRVAPPEQRQADAAGLLAAFRLNLTALSLISLFVGGFLVYATTRAALSRRREELGLLRALGATRGQVLSLVLGEAALLGLLGTAAGLPLGWLAARANVGAVSATLQNVYLLEGIEAIEVSPWLYLLAVAMGLAGAIAGALLPGLEVARRDPRALLAPPRLDPAGGARGQGALALAGWGLAALAWAWQATLGRALRPSGFVLAAALLVAVPLTAPWLLARAARLGRPRRLSLAYGLRTVGGRAGAAAVSAAALAVAVSMAAGVTVMIGSFRRTVETWLDDTLRADVYVTSPSWRRARSEAGLDPALVEALSRAPGVVAADRLRQVQVEAAGRRISLSGFDAGLPQSAGRVRLVEGRPEPALREVRDAGAALVSEPLSRKAGLHPGDVLPVVTPRGAVPVRIAGVYSDYGNEGGAALVSLPRLAQLFGPGAVSNVALYLGPGADPEREVDLLKRRFAGVPLLVRSNRTLRTEVLAIFEQTFAVTRLLQGVSLVIAAAGITLSLLVLARERAAELALYRALGATRGQLFLVFLGRGLGIACGGLVLGALGGAGLALVLVRLVNRAWFGWTIALSWPAGALGAQALTVLAAAALASLYPAARASRTPAAELSRDAL